MIDCEFPGQDWLGLPAEREWPEERLLQISRALETGGSSAFMIVESGRIAYQWGDVDQKSSVASVRKSLINVLYGVFVGKGRIDLTATLADMEIDDREPLSPEEQSATVLDLMKSRSGVYHPSVYDTYRNRPPRGSHPPGAFYFYNNWDFNVLATIFSLQTGESLFDAFATDVANPLGMQDFVLSDCFYQQGPQSRHPVYKMRFSARDLARIGLLYLRQGQWKSRQLLPRGWVADSIAAHSDLGGGRSYGYLWFAAEADAKGDAISAKVPVFYASGFGGQYILVLPALDLVIVHRAARVDHGISHNRMGTILRLALSAMPASDG